MIAIIQAISKNIKELTGLSLKLLEFIAGNVRFHMKYIEYYGDDRLRHKIVYAKDSYSECVYCGAEARTREHAPSKVFLNKPYPGDLPIVPACFKCNNSFSKDELFVAVLIEKLKNSFYGSQYPLSDETLARLDKNPKIASEIDNAIVSNDLARFDDRIKNVVLKLAISHAVYELSEGYCVENVSINYSFINHMSIEDREEFENDIVFNDRLYPEIGSRAYERIVVTEVSLQNQEQPEQTLTVPFILLDWVDVQESRYMYTCYNLRGAIVVKMIISDFLYVSVILYIE